MDTGIPLFFSEIEYLLLETIPLETIMRVENNFRILLHTQCSHGIEDEVRNLVMTRPRDLRGYRCLLCPKTQGQKNVFYGSGKGEDSLIEAHFPSAHGFTKVNSVDRFWVRFCRLVQLKVLMTLDFASLIR